MNTPLLRRKKRKQKANYAFMNFLLFAFCIQLLVSSIGNITKIISYNAKYNDLSHYMESAVILNEELLSDIDKFSVEEIAHNSLRSIEEDELLVTVNNFPLEKQRVY